MKLSMLFYLLLAVANLFGQDYVTLPDGTKHDGKIISLSKNNLKFENSDGVIETYKIDQLYIVHISNPDFKMNEVNFNNTSYEKNEDGIHIIMMDNENVEGDTNMKKKRSCKPNQSIVNTVSKSASRSNSKSTSEESEVKSSLSISSEDEGPKAKVILECDECSDSGTLVMESEDKRTNVIWTFECKKGSVFPMEMEIYSGKQYNFKYIDGNKQSIEKKVKIDSGVNIINVFQ